MSDRGNESQFPHELANTLISVTKASEITELGKSLSARHIQRLIKEEKIAGVRLGRNWFTTEEAVRDYLLQEHRPGPKPLS